MNAIACRSAAERPDTRISYLSDGSMLMSIQIPVMHACAIILTLRKHPLATVKAFNSKRNVGHVMKDTTAQIDTALTITLARPALVADPAADGWTDVSTVVVQRFLDAYWVKHGVSRETLNAYKADLDALHGWLKQAKARSLVTASSGDIRDFLTARIQRANASEQALPSLSCIKRFYAYLLASGYRSDDPTESVFVRTPRLRRDLTTVN